MTAIDETTPTDFRLGFTNGTDRERCTLQWQGQAHPDWLRARLVKNGPGMFDVGDQQYHHWFDGLALLLEFDFGDELTYMSQFLHSPDHDVAVKEGRIPFTEFATVPKRSFWKRLWCTLSPIAQFGDNASINFLTRPDSAIAISDLPGGLELDLDTLQVTGTFSLGRPPILLTNTPHPQHDIENGAWWNIGIGLSWRGFGYQVFSLADGSNKPLRHGFIRRSSPAYMHSVGMTDRYMVIIEHPMSASLAKFFTLALRKRPIIDAFAWDGEQPLTFIVVDRRTGEVAARVPVPAKFWFHAANVHEDGDDVVVDLCTYPDDRAITELYLDRLRGPDGGALTPSTFLRYRIDVAGGTATDTPITDASVEFPTVNPNHLHKPYRYTWAASVDPTRPNDYTNQLVKVDVQTGEVRTWSQPGCYPGEPIMVPNPAGIAEDHGVVLCVVLDAPKRASMLLMLDAETFTELGRAELPDVVPFGLHGVVIPRRTKE